jgi:hypothetical protein
MLRAPALKGDNGMPDSAETAADDYAGEWASLIDGRESTSICDVDGLSGADIRFLGRLGLWPDNSSRESGSTGSPYVSDVGKYRSLYSIGIRFKAR